MKRFFEKFIEGLILAFFATLTIPLIVVCLPLIPLVAFITSFINND